METITNPALSVRSLLVGFDSTITNSQLEYIYLCMYFPLSPASAANPICVVFTTAISKPETSYTIVFQNVSPSPLLCALQFRSLIETWRGI